MENNYVITSENVGARLDNFVCSCEKDCSRSHIKNMIENGDILLNGKVVKSGEKLRLNDQITVKEIEEKPLDITAENIDIEIVYEDGAWSRRANDFYKNGLISVSGSNGAASHSAKIMYIDKEGKLSTIYDFDAEGVYMLYLDPEELLPEDDYTSVNTYILGNGNKYAYIYNYDEDFNVIEAREEIYNKLFDIFTNEEYIVCNSEEEIDDYIEKYANEFGISLKNLESKLY